MTRFERLLAWASELRFEDIPRPVVELAKSQLLSQAAAARATLAHELGDRVTAAFGPPLQADPKQSAYVLAALTVALDYDDTMFAGHVSHSAANVPVAYAAQAGVSGREVLTAIVAANECAARVTAAATLGPFRGQTAGHTHLMGAVAGRLRIEDAPLAQWVNAAGIAFAAPPWALTHAFLGSDAKLLIAATPLRAGLDACDAAAAGLRGVGDVLEHDDGFLAAFAEVPLPEALDRGLGERWHTETISFKLTPGTAYLSACVECAAALHAELGPLRAADVEAINVTASIFTVELDKRVREYLRGAESSPIALNFSVPYNVACALLNGQLNATDLDGESVADPERWALAAKVSVEHDVMLSARAILATAPVGEALRLAGARAEPWLREHGGEPAAALVGALEPPDGDFHRAEKAIGATVEVRLPGGRLRQVTCDIPAGAVGSADRGDHARAMAGKFVANGGSEDVAAALLDVESCDSAAIDELLMAAFSPASQLAVRR